MSRRKTNCKFPYFSIWSKADFRPKLDQMLSITKRHSSTNNEVRALLEVTQIYSLPSVAVLRIRPSGVRIPPGAPSFSSVFYQKTETHTLRNNLFGIFVLQTNLAAPKASEFCFRTNLLEQLASHLRFFNLHGFRFAYRNCLARTSIDTSLRPTSNGTVHQALPI